MPFGSNANELLMPAPERKLRRTDVPEPFGATITQPTPFCGLMPVSLL